MSARDITAALSGRWQGRYGMACCPVHDDKTPSMTVHDADQGVTFHCFAGCDWREIRDELKRRGVLTDDHAVGKREEDRRRDFGAIQRRKAAGEPVTPLGNNRWRVGWETLNEKGEVVGI